MARGGLKDFTSKWGFDEGELCERRDYRARDKLVELLNANPVFMELRVTAVPYNRPGMHNSVMILVYSTDAVAGKSTSEILRADTPGAMWPVEVEDELDYEELIHIAYDWVDQHPEPPRDDVRPYRIECPKGCVGSGTVFMTTQTTLEEIVVDVHGNFLETRNYLEVLDPNGPVSQYWCECGAEAQVVLVDDPAPKEAETDGSH